MEIYNTSLDISVNEILIYLRKSRSDNPQESVEKVLQKHETILQDFSRDTWGLPVPEENIYREVVSGETIEARPMVQEILKLIELAVYKAVLIVEPQRLSRGDLEDCGRIINAFRYSNTLIITPPKTYSLADKYDRKFFEMELMRGNDYLEYTKEILRRGRIASVTKGAYIGSIAPYGWQKVQIDKSPTLKPDPAEMPALLMMYDLYVNSDCGFQAIALQLEKLGILPRSGNPHWNPAAIRDIIHNPVNNGQIRWNYRKEEKIMVDGAIETTRPIAKSDKDYILVQGLHEACITDEMHKLYEAAQRKRGRTTRKKASTKLRNPLSGLLYCPCGKAMTYRTYKSNGVERSAPRLLCTNQHNCHVRSVLYSEMIEAIIVVLQSSVQDFKIKLENDKGNSMEIHQDIISKLEDELKRLNEKDEKQKDLLEDGVYSKEDFLKRNSRLRKKKEEITQSLIEAKKSKPEAVNYEDKICMFSTAITMMRDDSADPAQLNRLLKSIIEKIEYHNEAGLKRQKGTTRTRAGWTDNNFSIDVFLRH